MRHERGQGPVVNLRIATACEGYYMWEYVLWDRHIVSCRYHSALMHFSFSKRVC